MHLSACTAAACTQSQKWIYHRRRLLPRNATRKRERERERERNKTKGKEKKKDAEKEKRKERRMQSSREAGQARREPAATKENRDRLHLY